MSRFSASNGLDAVARRHDTFTSRSAVFQLIPIAIIMMQMYMILQESVPPGESLVTQLKVPAMLFAYSLPLLLFLAGGAATLAQRILSLESKLRLGMAAAGYGTVLILLILAAALPYPTLGYGDSPRFREHFLGFAADASPVQLWTSVILTVSAAWLLPTLLALRGSTLRDPVNLATHYKGVDWILALVVLSGRFAVWVLKLMFCVLKGTVLFLVGLRHARRNFVESRDTPSTVSDGGLDQLVGGTVDLQEARLEYPAEHHHVPAMLHHRGQSPSLGERPPAIVSPAMGGMTSPSAVAEAAMARVQQSGVAPVVSGIVTTPAVSPWAQKIDA